jgi:hypothetical protein
MKLLIEADYHSHHRAGLNAPDWWMPSTGVYAKWGKLQRELWNKRLEILEKIGPVDAHALNADCFDGRGERSGGTELLPDASWPNQIANAEACIRAVKFAGEPRRIMSRGTPYHVGWDSDYEDVLAMNLGATIKDHPFFTFGGVTFDMKHKVGSSVIPHGRATPIARDRLWNLLWAEMGGQPKAQVVIRSHVHYFSYVGGSGWLGLTTPALQAAGTKYGGRQCSGTVDWGVVVFECEGGEYDWKAYLVDLAANKVQAVTL